VRRRLEEVTGGAAATPLALLFFLNLVDEFDQAALGILAPEIRNTFGLSDADLTSIVSATAALVLLLVVPVGALADRMSRVRLTLVAAIAWSTMSVLTGLAPTIAVFALARFGSGLGRVINEPVHASLLADYYPSASHGRVFSVHRMANPLALILVLISGILAETVGWRATFALLAVPTFITLAFVARLDDPPRGASLDYSLAARAETAGRRIPLPEAFRRLRAIRTLRRTWVSAFLLGAAVLPITVFFSFFYERVYGVERPGPWGRAGILAIYGAGAVIGLLIGSRLANRTIMSGDVSRLATLAGRTLVVVGIALFLMAVAPWMGLSILFTFLVGVSGAGFQSYNLPLVALVAPPRIRAQAYGWFVGWFALGAIAISRLISNIGDDQGYRWGIAVLSLLVIVAGVIYATARRFVMDDTASAAATLATEVRFEQDRATGHETLLVCRGLDVAYDQVQVLFGVDLEVGEGEIVALLGTNGAGKSTLLRAISGLVEPRGGAIFFDGEEVTRVGPRRAAELGIIQMPGGRSVFPTLTVDECLRLAAWMYKRRDRDHVRTATAQVREYFPILVTRADTLAGDLSGGEQQMLGLAMAFIAKPKLLMIDELTLGLAPTIVGRLVDIVRAIHARGTSVILVEQSVNTALLLAQRAVFLEKGEVRFSGATAQLFERPDILRSVFLEGAASIGTRNGEVRVRKAKKRAVPAGNGATDRAVVLEAQGLVRRYGGIVAVDGVDIDLHEGEILGLIGPNGAGKTTALDVLSGFLPADGGRVLLNGADVTAWGADRRARAGLGRSFQDARLFPSLTVAENIATALERHLEVRDPLAAFLGMPEIAESEVDVAWKVHDLIELLGLGAYRNKFVGELSTGTRRVVDLAMCMAHGPHVLLLDEPSSGIAQREAEALGPLLRRIQDETKCSMVVIEHDMPLVSSLADRLVAMEVGRVIATGPPRDVLRDPAVVTAYLGTDDSVVARSGRRTKSSKSR
jgi:ABC-type branched-subunit amino acid transport system ATPase component/predicted MFS family arabinose efflux permease